MLNILRKLIGSKKFGALKYRRNPRLGRAWGGPMNAQAARCKLVSDLICGCNFEAILETGTYLGTTTEWLSSFGLPIYSCEASEENFGFSTERLSGISNVHLYNQDSRTALRAILSGPLAHKADRPLLAYLDAHWHKDLPLADELDIIFSSHSESLVLVDDFRVPDDPGYSFDDYGPGLCLNSEYIASVAAKHELVCLYPSTSAEDETGARRGCVVIAQKSSKVLACAKSSNFLRSLR